MNVQSKNAASQWRGPLFALSLSLVLAAAAPSRIAAQQTAPQAAQQVAPKAAPAAKPAQKKEAGELVAGD